MKKIELFTLGLLLLGIVVSGLGTVLYLSKLMIENAVEWELQLAVLGVFAILFAIVMSKIFSKVNLDG